MDGGLKEQSPLHRREVLDKKGLVNGYKLRLESIISAVVQNGILPITSLQEQRTPFSTQVGNDLSAWWTFLCERRILG